jgi:peptidyl-prolyl cis-trans isomerase D
MNGEIPMKKIALLAVLLAAVLLLSSCNLVVKDEAVDAATVILKMGDTEVTKAQVQDATQDQLLQMYQYYGMLGYQVDMKDPAVLADAQNAAVTALKQDMVLRAKAAELGLDQLTEEELAKVQEAAEADVETSKTYIKASYLTEEQQALEGEELDAAIQEQLDLLGISVDSYIDREKDQLIDQKVYDYAVKDVEVTDEEVKADYDAKVAADEEKYKENASAWTSADRSGSTLYYAPAGIRRVRQILIKFSDEDQAAVDEANAKVTEATSKVTAAQKTIGDESASEEDKAKAQEDLAAAEAELEAAGEALKTASDAAYANIDEDADAVLAALAENPDSWDDLVKEKNGDPGMKEGALNAERGYSVCEGMSGFDSAFVDAAMALSSVGDVSGKTRGTSGGYYIIKYVSDVAEGSVDYDSVKDKIHETLLSGKKDTVYTDTLNAWIEAAGIKEDLGALK